jgi:hypothetical protein
VAKRAAVNPERLEQFMKVYRQKLEEAVLADPGRFALERQGGFRYTPAEFADVVSGRVRDTLSYYGGVIMDGPAMTATMKHFDLGKTRQSLNRFLRGE